MGGLETTDFNVNVLVNSVLYIIIIYYLKNNDINLYKTTSTKFVFSEMRVTSNQNIAISADSRSQTW